MFTKGLTFGKDKMERLSLQDNASIVIAGGGPAGTFFAIQTVRKARALGKAIDLIIIKKKLIFVYTSQSFSQT